MSHIVVNSLLLFGSYYKIGFNTCLNKLFSLFHIQKTLYVYVYVKYNCIALLYFSLGIFILSTLQNAICTLKCMQGIIISNFKHILLSRHLDHPHKCESSYTILFIMCKPGCNLH